MAKKTRMFMYHRKRFVKLARLKQLRVPRKVWRMQMREWFGPYGPIKNKHMFEPDRVTRLREVLHCGMAEAGRWAAEPGGDYAPQELLWHILACARCNIPSSGMHVQW